MLFFTNLALLFIQLKSICKASIGFWLSLFYNKIWSLVNPNRPIRPGDVSISTTWLTQVLRIQSVIDVKTSVVEALVEDLDGNRGLTSSINIVKLKYSPNRPDLNNVFVIKKNNLKSVKTRYMSTASGASREACFYQDFASDNTPKHIYAYVCKLSGSFIILMENAKLFGTDVNFYFGNQIWGMKPLEKPIDPVIILKNILELAARMHAKYWNDKRLLKIKWLKSVDWYCGKNKSNWQLGLRRAEKIWMRTKNTKTSNTDIKWSKKLISIIDKSFAYSTWSNFQKEFANSTPFTLCHGDFHAANMINKQDNALILIDWSEVGIWSPMTDIGQLFISDIKPELRRTNELQLIKHYWRQLIQNGVSAHEYPFEECWKSYESSPIERWIWMFAYLSGMDLPAKAIQYFHDQLLSFIEDHSDRPYYILKPVSVVG